MIKNKVIQESLNRQLNNEFYQNKINRIGSASVIYKTNESQVKFIYPKVADLLNVEHPIDNVMVYKQGDEQRICRINNVEYENNKEYIVRYPMHYTEDNNELLQLINPMQKMNLFNGAASSALKRVAHSDIFKQRWTSNAYMIPCELKDTTATRNYETESINEETGNTSYAKVAKAIDTTANNILSKEFIVIDFDFTDKKDGNILSIEEGKHLCQTINNYLTESNLPPHFVVFSGGGAHAYFKFERIYFNTNNIRKLHKHTVNAILKHIEEKVMPNVNESYKHLKVDNAVSAINNKIGLPGSYKKAYGIFMDVAINNNKLYEEYNWAQTIDFLTGDIYDKEEIEVRRNKRRARIKKEEGNKKNGNHGNGKENLKNITKKRVELLSKYHILMANEVAEGWRHQSLMTIAMQILQVHRKEDYKVAAKLAAQDLIDIDIQCTNHFFKDADQAYGFVRALQESSSKWSATKFTNKSIYNHAPQLQWAHSKKYSDVAWFIEDTIDQKRKQGITQRKEENRNNLIKIIELIKENAEITWKELCRIANKSINTLKNWLSELYGTKVLKDLVKIISYDKNDKPSTEDCIKRYQADKSVRCYMDGYQADRWTKFALRCNLYNQQYDYHRLRDNKVITLITEKLIGYKPFSKKKNEKIEKFKKYIIDFLNDINSLKKEKQKRENTTPVLNAI